MTITRKGYLKLCAAVIVFILAPPAWSQIPKELALKEVKVVSHPGWRESISEEGRFRVLFPGQPEIDDDVISVKGFKLQEPSKYWRASYTDFDQPRASDTASLRQAYKIGVNSLIGRGAKLLAQKDVFQNGRLGHELVIEEHGTVSYMRFFLVDRRMYSLAVGFKRVANGKATIPTDVQSFFESFAYWDVK